MKVFNLKVLYLLILFIPLISFSQTKTLDSLKKVYYSNFDSLTAKSYLFCLLGSWYVKKGLLFPPELFFCSLGEHFIYPSFVLDNFQ